MVYDPLTAMFFSPDPYLQAPENWLNYNRYGYCLNNPFLYTDPDGEWIHIVIGALVGGVINWAAHGAQFSWDGLAAFGVGAAGGAVVAATGGAALGVFGTTAGASGFIGGAVAGGVAYTYGTAVTSIGNNAFFGDPMPTTEQFATGLGISMLTGGTFNGAAAALGGNNFWSGNPVAQGRGVFAFNNTPKPAAVQSIPKIQGTAIPQPELQAPEQKPLQHIKPSNDSFTITTQEKPQVFSVEGNNLNIAPPRPQIIGYKPDVSTKVGLSHRFPYSFDEIIVQSGDFNFTSQGNYWYVAPGSVNTGNGWYSIGMYPDGTIFHRGFFQLLSIC